MRTIDRIVTIALVAGGASCGGSLRTVPTGPHVDPRPEPVQEAPPPAKVESVPPDPGEPCAWLDGRWEWRGRSWEWLPGAWVVPAPGCHYAPPFALWTTSTQTGVLYHYPGRWVPDATGGKCPRPRRCSANP